MAAQQRLSSACYWLIFAELMAARFWLDSIYYWLFHFWINGCSTSAYKCYDYYLLLFFDVLMAAGLLLVNFSELLAAPCRLDSIYYLIY